MVHFLRSRLISQYKDGHLVAQGPPAAPFDLYSKQMDRVVVHRNGKTKPEFRMDHSFWVKQAPLRGTFMYVYQFEWDNGYSSTQVTMSGWTRDSLKQLNYPTLEIKLSSHSQCIPRYNSFNQFNQPVRSAMFPTNFSHYLSKPLSVDTSHHSLFFFNFLHFGGILTIKWERKKKTAEFFFFLPLKNIEVDISS